MDYEEIMRALRNADAAGDTEAAKRLAQMARDAKPVPSKYPEGTQILAEVDGGQVYQLPDGQRGFSGPSYSTTDQAKVDEMLAGVQPQTVSKIGFLNDVVSQKPVASRAAAAIQGVPFVGEYSDEVAGALFGDKARDTSRLAARAMQQTRPKETMALQLGTGIAASLPMALAAGPSIAARLPVSMAGKIATGGAVGAVGGGVEGAISGYGAGSGESRSQNAVSRGMFGALIGGGIGALAPAIGGAVGRGVEALRARAVNNEIAGAGLDRGAARMLSNVAEADKTTAGRNIAAAGSGAMVADAGPNTRQLLDLAIQGAGPGATSAREAVQNRATAAGRQMVDALDKTLGKPAGINAIQRDVMQASAPARSAAYDAAYASSINYDTPAGQELIGLLDRVPDRIKNNAGTLARAEGYAVAGGQPDVRQIDYITRALRDEASNAGRSGSSDLSRVYNGLAREIRTRLGSNDLVPAYRAARDAGADAIAQREAAQTGRDMLRTATTREDLADEIAGMGADELSRVKQGLRGYIDDVMANAKRALTDRNMDAREVVRTLSELTTRAGREKMEMVLGKDASTALQKNLDEVYGALSLRAGLADNSKTFVRQEFRRLRDELSQPGPMEILTEQGRPIDAGRRLLTSVIGSDPAMAASQEQSVMSNLAKALTSNTNPVADIQRYLSIGPALDAAASAGKSAANATTAGIAATIPLVSSRQQNGGPSRARARAIELANSGITDQNKIETILRREGLIP